jgi:hypothetical protein
MGGTFAHPDNRVKLSKNRKDKWGLPLMDFDCIWRENELSMRADMMNSAGEAGEIGIEKY